MPIYEYRCKQCGERFELLRRASDSDDEVRCERCGADQVEKLFSAFATSGGSSGFASSAGSCSSTGGFT